MAQSGVRPGDYLVRFHNLSDLTNSQLARGNIGLGHVDDTSDLNKPISAAMQAALDSRAAAVHFHSGSDITSGTVAYSHLPVGTAANTVAAGNDVRLTEIRPVGNIINWIGDSIADPLKVSSGINGVTPGVQLNPTEFLSWAHILSSGRILYGKVAGTTGQNASQMAARIVTDALSNGGSYCGISVGTNDASQGRTTSAFAADIVTMCAAIRASGMIPILNTGVPTPNTGSPNQRKQSDLYRRFVTAYAASNGWPLVDFFAVLVDSSTGGYLAGYDNGDGIHPNAAGKKVMAQALVDALTPRLMPFSPPLPQVNPIAQSGNLLDNALFLTDTNTDGVPDGWTKTGNATVSIVTGDSNIKGNALRITDAASSGFTQVTAAITITGLPGHRLAYTGLVKPAGTTSATVELTTGGASTNIAMRPCNGLTGVSTWQKFYLEVTVPGTATSLTAKVTTNGGAAVDLAVAQLGVFDLTAAGI